MRRTIGLSTAMIAIAALVAPARAGGDAARGAKQYRACVGCHSLEPGSHLSGPSLAGRWGERAGEADGFMRYSKALRAAELSWDADTLNAWLADPQALVPGTFMAFRGIKDDQARSDLIAFLALAMAPGGGNAVVGQGLVPREYVRGQKPDALGLAPTEAVVIKVRHCRDSYFVATADGVETPYWEMNVRFKLDTRETGPEPGRPVVLGAGMAGDRVSIIFSSLQELKSFVADEC